MQCNRVTFRKHVKLIGKLVASFSAVLFGLLQYRDLEQVKITGFKFHYNNFDRKFNISDEVKIETPYCYSQS